MPVSVLLKGMGQTEHYLFFQVGTADLQSNRQTGLTKTDGNRNSRYAIEVETALYCVLMVLRLLLRLD